MSIIVFTLFVIGCIQHFFSLLLFSIIKCLFNNINFYLKDLKTVIYEYFSLFIPYFVLIVCRTFHNSIFHLCDFDCYRKTTMSLQVTFAAQKPNQYNNSYNYVK